MKTHRPFLAAATAFLASALLAAACSIDPVVVPSPAATPAESPRATASPSPTASARPTPSPTPEPSSSVLPAPSPSPSAPPSQPPPVGERLFTDDFGDATSPRWGTGTHAAGSVAYADGTLRIGLTADESSLWSWRVFPSEQTLGSVHAEGTVAPSGTGAAGWLCGIGDDRFVGGLIHSSGEWVIVDITDGRSSALQRGPLPAGIDPAATHRLAVECSRTGDGPVRIRLLVDGQQAVSFESSSPIGDFDRVGAYAFADVAGYSTAFDDAAVFGGSAATDPVPGSPSPTPAP